MLNEDSFKWNKFLKELKEKFEKISNDTISCKIKFIDSNPDLKLENEEEESLYENLPENVKLKSFENIDEIISYNSEIVKILNSDSNLRHYWVRDTFLSSFKLFPICIKKEWAKSSITYNYNDMFWKKDGIFNIRQIDYMMEIMVDLKKKERNDVSLQNKRSHLEGQI